MRTMRSNAQGSQGSSTTDTERLSWQRFADFDLDRSRDCRRRHRVLSSAWKVAELFHHEDRQRLH